MSKLIFRLAAASDITAVLAFWAMAAEDSGRPIDSADAMVLDANDSAHHVWADTGYRRQPDWSRWVESL